MKLARMSSLMLVAAMVTMALIVTSSAAAETTALCNVDQDPCKEANQVTEVHYEAHNTHFLGEYAYGCSDALLSAAVGKLGTPQTLEAQSMTYTSCGGGCTRTTEELGTLSVLRTANESAEVVVNGFKTKVTCSGFSNCIYVLNEQVGVLQGPLLTGDNGHITFEEVPLEKVGGSLLCPAEVRFDALFEASKQIYVSS